MGSISVSIVACCTTRALCQNFLFCMSHRHRTPCKATTQLLAGCFLSPSFEGLEPPPWLSVICRVLPVLPRLGWRFPATLHSAHRTESCGFVTWNVPSVQFLGPRYTDGPLSSSSLSPEFLALFCYPIDPNQCLLVDSSHISSLRCGPVLGDPSPVTSASQCYEGSALLLPLSWHHLWMYRHCSSRPPSWVWRPHLNSLRAVLRPPECLNVLAQCEQLR